MAEPNPSNVAPWFLRNINEALELDPITGNVFVRTGITGNVIISGPVTIPGTVNVASSPSNPVHVHLDEVGTSGILTVPYLPIGGNVTVTDGNVNAVVTGSVASTQSGTWLVNVQDGGNSLTVDGNVSITGNANVVIQGTPNVNANVSGNVGILGNANVVIQGTPNVNANITGGNVNANITGGNVRANVTGTVSVSGNIAGITALPAITGNVNANITGGNVNAVVSGSVAVTGNIAGITALPAITGNVNANITGGNVNANITGGNVKANVTGTVSISGNIAGITDLPDITGNVNANITGGNVNAIVSGSVAVTGNIAGITALPAITGNVNANITGGNINANITGGNVNAAVTGSVAVTGNIAGITALPAITGNVNANITGGNVNAAVTGSVAVTGNIAGITALPAITGNVNANVSGNVGILGNANVVIQGTPNVNANVSGNVGILGNANVVIQGTPNVNANVSGNVGVIGNVAVTQATSPWVVTGNVTTTPAINVGDFYGEPYAIPITPVVQTYGVYGINPQDIQTYLNGGGTANSYNSCYSVTSTATVGSYAVLRSRRFNTYKPGQSLMARFFAQMSSPAAGTSQRIGLQNQEGGYYIGYNGVVFGVLQVHNARAPIYEITITSYTGNQTVTVTLNGVAYNVNILVGETPDNAAQRISQINFGGLWLANQRDNTVELLYTGVGPLVGAFTVTSSGNLVSTIVQQQAGVAATNTWYLDGTSFTKPTWLDPTKFNDYQIKYSWAGVNFFALNPTTGQYQLFYQLLWAGSSSANVLPVANPAFKIAALAVNTGGSTSVTVNVASMMSGLEGITNRNNYTGAAATTQTSLNQNTLHHLLSIQNPYTFNNTINTKEALMDDLTASMQCNDPTEVLIFLDAPLLTGIQDFKSQDGYSVTVSEATGTIDPTTNFPICSFIVGITGSSVQFGLNQYRVVIPPGSTMSIAVQSTAAIQKASAAIVWYND